MSEFETERDVMSGPLRHRKFTDVFCLLIFAAFWVFVAVIAVTAYTQGDMDNIAQPYDSDGYPCGKEDRLDYRYLFIDNPRSSKYNEKMVCVRRCPKEDDERVDCVPNSSVEHCHDLTTYASYGFASRLCIPKSRISVDSVKKRINISYINTMVEDIKDAMWVFIVMVVISITVCFLWYFLVQYCAGIMIMVMLLGSLVALIFFGVINWNKYKDFSEESDYNQNTANNYKNTAIVLWVLSGIFLLLILCLIGRIKLAAKMMQAAADFITDRPSVLLVPIIYTFLTAGFIIWWMVTFLYMYSVGELKHSPSSIFGKILWTQRTEAYVWSLIVALLWGISFNDSASIFIIAAMSAGWYFGRYEGQSVGLFQAMSWAYSYHIGTLAFGSLIIAALWLIQIVLDYMYQKLKDIGQENFLYKCAMYFVSCFERFMRFLNKHAYIEVVLRNHSFCPAAMKCVEVLTTNFLRFSILSGLVGLFLFLGTIAISISITIIGNYILKAYSHSFNAEFETIGPILVG